MGVNNKCFVELATDKLTPDQMQAIEDRCNSCIRQRLAMTPRWLDPDDPELQQVSFPSLAAVAKQVDDRIFLVLGEESRTP